MAGHDLQKFIEQLRKNGELAEISAPVSPELEITEITDRVSKANGPALLFRNVEGSPYPVLINAMGSYRRMGMALGAEKLDDIGAEIDKYIAFVQEISLSSIFKNFSRLLRLLHVFPLRSPLRGACQQVVEMEPDLSVLPVLKCWPQDAGRFFTLPLVFTKHRETKRQNVGMYRLQVLDRTTTGMHWHRHKDGSEIYRSYAAHGEKMPVSVALGCDPAVTYAATAPLPKWADEMMLAGWLRKSNVKLVKCVTNGIYVPANAEFVLEGYVDPNEEPVLEGPFGDHTGYYSLADDYPRFHVTCITHKKHPVYPATVVGRPPMEDCYMAKATERIFLPLLRMQIPELVDLNLPLEGVFHNCALVSVRGKYPGAARKVMNAMWGMGQMMYTKLIVAVDESVDVQNPEEVRDALLTRVNGANSLFFCEGPLDALDHSSARALYGTRLGIDATGEAMAPGTFRVIPVQKEHAFQGREAAEQALLRGGERFVIAVDGSVDPADLSTVLWKTFNNIDAARDLVIQGEKIGVDATRKWPAEGLTRPWPDDITMTDEIKRRVEERWKEYGIAENH